MFARRNNRLTTSASKKSNRRLSLESLEGREMMTTTHLIIDYTPDTHAGNFVDTFNNSRYAGNVAPKFLDFNRDGRVNSTDVNIATQQIHNKVASIFNAAASGYNVSLQGGDVWSNTNWGTRYVQWGQQYASEQVEVIFVGGKNGSEAGRAPEAFNGYNVEGYGQVYTQKIANTMMLSDPQNTGWQGSSMFVAKTAGAIAHEMGHMLGLRHSLNQYTNDMMNPVQSQNPGAQAFLNVSRKTEDGTFQNPYQELRASFAGQRQMSGYWGGGQPLHDHDHDNGHDHDANQALANVGDVQAGKVNVNAVDAAFGDLGKGFEKYQPSNLAALVAQTPHATVNRVADALAGIIGATAKAKAAPADNADLHDLALSELVA